MPRPIRTLILLMCLANLPVAVPAAGPRIGPPPSSSQRTRTGPEHVEAPADEARPPQPATRQQLLRQRRLAKTISSEPRRERFYERYLRSLDRQHNPSIEDANLFGFRPRITWLAPGSGPAAGSYYWKAGALARLDVLGAAFYSIYDYQLYELNLGQIPNRGKRMPPTGYATARVDALAESALEDVARFKLYLRTRWRDRPREDFYGLGPDSELDTRGRYGLSDTLVELNSGYQFGDRSAFNVAFGWLESRLDAGQGQAARPQQFFESSRLPGLGLDIEHLRLRTSFLLDHRDEPLNPHSGWFAAFGYERMEQRSGDRFDFNAFALDTRAYLPLGSRQRVLALRAGAVFSQPDADNRVPIHMQPTLGGDRTLRGFANYRFRGEDLMLYQLEYRWEAAQRVELALFGDAGAVSAPGASLRFSDLESNVGVGIRYKSSRSVMIRLDQAWSREGARFHFRFEGSF